MKIVVILLLLLIGQALANLQYDSGYSNFWNYASIQADATQEQTITFSQQFSRIPQVSINPVIIADQWENKANSGYEISVSSITKLDFKVKIHIPSLTNVCNFQTFNWMAIDDSRIEVLSNFNEANPQSKILSHNNPRADTGIVFFTSFHGSSKLYFTISIGAITKTTVEVNIVQQNMISLGYIVILGPSEFFNLEAEIFQLPKDQNDPQVYLSRTVAQEPNRIWLFFLKYFTFDVNRSLKVQLKPAYISSSQISPSYKFCSWQSSYLSFSQCVHYCATFKFLPVNSIPMLFQKLRISSLVLEEQTENFDFSIQDLGFTSIPPIIQKILISKTIKTLTFIIKVKCNKNNQKIKASLYQCSSCQSNYKTIIRQCFNSEITFQYFITYNIQDMNQEQYLIIQMTSIQLKIQQTVYSQEVPTDFLIGQFDII